MPRASFGSSEQRTTSPSPSGLENPRPGSTAELLQSADSATLLTRTGSEVIVGHLRPLTDGWWSGEILHFAPGAGRLRLGADVRFHEDNVLGATL